MAFGSDGTVQIVSAVLGTATAVLFVEVLLVLAHAPGFAKSYLLEDAQAYALSRTSAALVVCGACTLIGATVAHVMSRRTSERVRVTSEADDSKCCPS